MAEPGFTRPETLPPTVVADLAEPLGDYVLRRLQQHTVDSYAGIQMAKLPEDLRVYEHLLWLADPDVVVELGTLFGGMTLWLRDRLHAFARYRRRPPARVIGVDLDTERTRECLSAVDPGYAADIELIAGDITDPGLPARVGAHVPPGARCLVIEDSAHTYESTLASLRGFSRFVPVGGFLVVEDGVVDVEPLRVSPSWPRGVLAALAEWLGAEGADFVSRSDLELYGVSCHPRGYLQRRR